MARKPRVSRAWPSSCRTLASGFVAGAVYGLVGVGYAVVFRLTGVVHFAFGELIALGVFVTLYVAAGSGPVSQTSVGGPGSCSHCWSGWSSPRRPVPARTCSRSSRTGPAAR